jgi:hypothetical protein
MFLNAIGSHFASARPSAVGRLGTALGAKSLVAAPRRARTARRRLAVSMGSSAVLAVVLFAGATSSASALGIKGFFAANCNRTHAECGAGASHPSEAQAETELFVAAGGYVPFGITDFAVATEEVESGVYVPEGYPYGSVKNVRVDVSPGVVTNPRAVAQCSMEQFQGTLVNAEHGFYTASNCPEGSIIGEQKVLLAVEVAAGHFADVPLTGTVYNLKPPPGEATDFGVAVSVGPLVMGAPLYSHTYIEGDVEWASDYHDYFVIKNVTPGLLESRLIFNGNKRGGGVEGSSGFIRNATSCVPRGPSTTTGLKLESYLGQVAETSYESPLGTEECGLDAFAPTFVVRSEDSEADHANGVTAETVLPQRTSNFTEPGTADVKQATVTLPKGLTLNPSAAAGLTACKASQFAPAGSSRAFAIRPVEPVSCPASSQIGTVTVEVPTLPGGSLIGPIYLGGNEPITKPPYTIYMVAESAQYGVQLRTKATVTPNPATGQLQATIVNGPGETDLNLPEAPFSSIAMAFNGGAHAPIANPNSCGAAESAAVFTPYAEEAVGPATLPGLASLTSAFTVGGCPAAPFAAPALSQSTALTPQTAGAESSLSFTLTRPEGQQYLQQLTATLPPGVVGKIPSVTLCPEAQANAGTCTAASLLGTATVAAGSGSPYSFTGNVYLTEAYEGAPYGLSVVVSSAAGPFNFGNVVLRAKVAVNQTTAQVVVTVVRSFLEGTQTSGLPTIIGGIPIRIRSLTVDINRPHYLLNPTNCESPTGVSTLGSTSGLTATVSSPVTVTGCSSLGFAPKFAASTNARATRADGASLRVSILEPVGGQANIKTVVSTLPGRLPSRLDTLNHACPEAQAAANILACPAASKVGTVAASTPVLAGQLAGPVYIVSHGGHAFPDLDLVLRGDGVQVVLVGNTVIHGNNTTTTFASNPDVPITGLALGLPMAYNSLLSTNGSLCVVPLYMPTTITAQNGKQLVQQTNVSVSNCLPITQHAARGMRAMITVRVPQAGGVVVTGAGLATAVGRARHSGLVRLSVPLSASGRRTLDSRHRLTVPVRVAFRPRARGGASFVSNAVVRFRR